MRNGLSTREKIIDEVIRVALDVDDSVVINFTLKRCYNKQKLFESFGKSSYLHVATAKNFVNSLRILIEHNFDINQRDINGDTCLHLASKRGYLRILFILLEAKADPFVANKGGKHALDLACNYTVKEIIRHYSAKCTEIKLIKNLKTWKEIFADEKTTKLTASASLEEKLHAEKSYSMQDLSRCPIKRTDSGIVEDETSVESPKHNQVAKHSLSFDDAKKQSVKQSGSNIEKSKFFFIGGAILGASLSPLSPTTVPFGSGDVKKDLSKNQKMAKSASMRDFSRQSAIFHSLSHRSIGEEDEDIPVKTTPSLKISPHYQEQLKRTSTQNPKKRKKLNRNDRMSMPEIKILSSGESYI